jgi:hypothetical protein
VVFPLWNGTNKNDDLVWATDSLSVTPILLNPRKRQYIETIEFYFYGFFNRCEILDDFEDFSHTTTKKWG